MSSFRFRSNRRFSRRARRAAALASFLPAVALASFALFSPVASRAADTTARLANHVPSLVAASQALGRADGQETLALAIALPLRNQGALTDLLARLYDPNDAAYGQYLTSEEFTARFAPTAADYEAVAAYAKAQGFVITGVHANRALLDVAAPAHVLERAFGLRLLRFQAPDGRVFRAPDVDPTVPDSLARRISGIIGLDNAAVIRPHNVRRVIEFDGLAPYGSPFAIGSGPNGGLSPSDIKTAYNLNGVSTNGSGQTLALFELDGYTKSDITTYESHFGLPAVPLQNVLIDGYSGAAGSGAGEVTLDIELQIALAPGATKILVYEAPNSTAGLVDTYNRIASDNAAKEISSSWGLNESSSGATTRNSENTAFQQMAAQGQSIFAASGDSGAYDNGSSLSVDDPASQPYMVGVGGTTLATNGAGGSYQSETTWNGGSISGGGGGGGISVVWPIPSFQSGVVSGASKGSTTKRNVPDVSLDADPNTGYAIYVSGGWQVYGGTSCAAPLWSAFTALVNQQRINNGSALLGFANPPIYTAAKSASYNSYFHDIANGSTNLYYPAVTGFDDATGWGTFNGANLLTALAGSGGGGGTVPSAPTGLTATPGNAQVSLSWNASSGATSYSLYRATTSGGEASYRTGLTSTTFTDTGLTNGVTYFYKVTASNSVGQSGLSSEASATPSGGGITPQQLLGNPGFETGSASPWSASSGVIDSSAGEAAHSGTWKAWLDGYGSAHTDTLYQQVSVPSGASSATLSFWLHVDTAETTTSTAYDTLKVQLRNSGGTVLTTLGTYSNLNKNTGYAQKVFDVSAYRGQTIQVYLIGVEDSSLQTSFVVDDFALNVQ